MANRERLVDDEIVTIRLSKLKILAGAVKALKVGRSEDTDTDVAGDAASGDGDVNSGDKVSDTDGDHGKQDPTGD